MTITIGQVASLAGVPTATVRYYERRGLITPAARTRSGYRQYGPAAAERLRFIKRAQHLGFSLEEIQDLLELRVADRESCLAVERRTREKVDQVRRKIRELRGLEDALERLADACRTRTPTAECPILESLSDEAADG